MNTIHEDNNMGTSDNPAASGSHNNSRALDLVPGSSVTNQPQHIQNNRNNTQPTSEQHAPLDVALTAAGRIRQRRKWTYNINETLLRIYYQVTAIETNMTEYRQRLHTAFNIDHPEYNATEQRLADQIRVIHRNNLIPESSRERIKDEIRGSIMSDAPIEEYVATVNMHDENREEIIQAPDNQNSNEDNTEFLQETTETFWQLFSLYNGSNPALRPTIAKINTSRKACKIIKHLNENIIPNLLHNIESLEDLHTVIYSAAQTTTTLLGRGPKPQSQPYRRKDVKSKPWLKRLEGNIIKLRSQISSLNEYLNGNKSRRLKRNVNRICQKFPNHSRYESNDQMPRRVLDTLKQKLSVIKTKRQKYIVSEKRKINNARFYKNEKTFYRGLREFQSETDDMHHDLPTVENTEQYWSSIWSNPLQHNTEAQWIKNEKENMSTLTPMANHCITSDNLNAVLTKAQNWKAPGVDKIQNFWYKRLISTHHKLVQLFNSGINNPSSFPIFLTEGITYLLPKAINFNGDPSKGRPITCLSTMYKILTACINNSIYKHLSEQNVIAEEQKGCIRGARGCKEQLTIDQIILEQASKGSRNLYVGYIDYQKAFDSIPHSWLIEVLSIYKIHPTLVNFLASVMNNWRTTIEVKNKTLNRKTGVIPIRRGIFQGDCLSALWFCIAINSLSRLLNDSGYGFKIKKDRDEMYQVNHLLYMDDLKLYASTKTHLNHLLTITKFFSDDIKMSFGIDKCKTITITRGKISPSAEPELFEIGEMSQDDVYKYLGVMQSRRLEQRKVKQKLTNEVFGRIHKLAKSHLNGKNLFKAINTYAIPVLTYSFGIIRWTVTELNTIQRKIRTTLTKYRVHHPKSCVERMTLPRKLGGRGLADLQLLHENQIKSLRRYFHDKVDDSDLLRAITSVDETYTPMKLQMPEIEMTAKTNTQKIEDWALKALHGKYYHTLSNQNVDQKMSNKWLTNGSIYAESEGLMFAIQDEVLPTRNYIKYIIKESSAHEDVCRRCGMRGETIDHIISGCPTLAQSDYLKRHNNVAKIIHIELLKLNNIALNQPRYYLYEPEPVIETDDIRIYFDRTIYTMHRREHNRPDITIVNKTTKEGFLVDVAVPLSRNMEKTYSEKINKYAELATELKAQWKLKSVQVVPITISSVGIIHKNLTSSIKTLKLKEKIIENIQKAVIIDTCHVIRKFLQ